jgi:hypothetical protein
MDMTGSNLVLQAALGQEGYGDLWSKRSSEQTAGSSLPYEMHDAGYRSRQATTFKFAAVTLLVVVFLGVLFAIASVTHAPDGEVTAGRPIPVAAPTAVLE